MVDRASTFSDPEVIAAVRASFVPVAIDQWYHRRQKDAEGDFYRKIAGQGPQKDFNATTQGIYACGPDGALLGFTNNRSPDRVRGLLKKALADFKPAEVAGIGKGKGDPNFSYEPPAGGLVVTVTARVLEGHELSEDPDLRRFQESTGRDVLWVRKDEQDALARGEFPESLRRRLAQYTLTDFTRGEPGFWDPKEILKADFALKDGELSGSAHLESPARGFKPRFRGVVETKDGRVTRFDLVAHGEAWGYGGVTATAAPKGKFTLGIAYRLASGGDEADKVMPQGAKAWYPDYMR